jgi:lipoyl(octanoyl) transferase
MSETCVVEMLGRLAYLEAWQLQERLGAEIASGEHPPTLLLLEHPPTYTFGRRGHAENLLWDAAELQRRGLSVHWVDRGGDVTYHGPGQLVGYPLLKLASRGLTPGDGTATLPKADYVGYLRKLEGVLILALKSFGVEAKRIPGLTGVWVPMVNSEQAAKIAAIGVKVDAHGVTRHGFALNVNPDMSYWQGIIGCGLKDAQETSLAELCNPCPTIGEVAQEVVRVFGKVFDLQMVIAHSL